MQTASLRQILAGGEWQRRFEPGALQRGVAYVREARVVALEHQEIGDADVLIADVRGQANHIYSVSILVAGGTDGERSWACECSCPVGRDCKHAVATLIFASRFAPEQWPRRPQVETVAPDGIRRDNAGAARQRLGELIARIDPHRPVAPERPSTAGIGNWDRWLARVDTDRKEDLRIAEPGRVFGILLHADRGSGRPKLLAAPVWLRPGKTRKAGLVNPRGLELEEAGPVPAPAGGWSAPDLAALALLLQDPYEARSGVTWTRIDAVHLENALLDLATRHPVFFERAANGPLERGEPLALGVGWRDLPDGGQRLVLTVGDTGDTGETVLVQGGSLWYVQPGARRYGRVEGDPQWLDAIEQAPVLAPEQVAGLRKRLGGRNGAISIPAPAERGAIRRVEAQATAVLRVRVIELWWRQNYQRRRLPVGCARLSFEYAGHRVPADLEPRTRVLRNGEVLEIVRDREAEQRIEDLLDESGLFGAEGYALDQGTQATAITESDFLLQPDERKPPFAPEAWKPVLKRLADQDIRIEYEPGFPRDEIVDIDAWHARIDEEETPSAWFEVALGIDIGGERVDLLPILRRVLADPRFSLAPRKGERADAKLRMSVDAERSVELPLARLRALIEPLLEWIEGGREGALRVHRSEAASLARLGDEQKLDWRGGERLRAQLELLRSERRDGTEPPGFRTRLRDYQRDGLAWLGFLADAGLGGVLADDMGLGKTVQVLAHVLAEKQRGRLDLPALVVAPTSLVGNWRDEAARFAPDLRVLVLHGADRAVHYASITGHDLVITTYPLLPRDRERLVEARFSLLILDEAQAIKNPKSQAAQVVREIVATRRLAMTGTPLENHLGELWAQFDAVEPGLLGSERHFARFYRTPIEKHGDAERQQRLNRRVAPLLLRRRKQDVLTELPPKTEIVQRLDLEGAQRELYETLRLAQHERVRLAVRERGLAQSGIVVLDALLKLRQVCCDPRLVKLDSARKVRGSAKLDALLERLDGLVDEGRRVLLFSQFTEMLELIAQALEQKRMRHLRLTGDTPAKQRTALVNAFQDGEAPVFLISLKAGGVGLNLTAADTVIHYDPWWNPAVEAQATDRAHRIGQDKAVFVYKLICAGTVEEKIQALQTRKAELARAVLEGGSSQQLKLDEADLAELFAPL
jgi:superfamily II DNA or RNA helicase